MPQPAVVRPRHSAPLESDATAAPAAHPVRRPDGSRLRALDGLRLLAALAVGVYHYVAYTGSTAAWGQDPNSVFPQWSPMAAYGWLGVEIFFIISGFAICMSCWGRTVGDFFRSRVTRLY